MIAQVNTAFLPQNRHIFPYNFIVPRSHYAHQFPQSAIILSSQFSESMIGNKKNQQTIHSFIHSLIHQSIISDRVQTTETKQP
jgi:hypothetical protein